MVNVEKRKEPAEGETQGLQLTPRRVLPTPKKVESPKVSEPAHTHEQVHERMARHYSLTSESAGRSGAKAGADMEIVRNMDDHKVKWGDPLHQKFKKLVASV